MSQTDPDSPTPPPSRPLENLVAQIPGFRTHPSRQPRTDPLDPEATTVESPSPPSEPALSGGLDGESDEQLDDPLALSSTTGPIPGPRQVVTGDPRAFARLFETLFRLIGRFFNARFTPGHPTLWRPDEQDIDAVADPFGRIAGRHTRFASGEQANDILDGIEGAIGLTGYAVKNQDRTREWRRQGGPTLEQLQEADQ